MLAIPLNIQTNILQDTAKSLIRLLPDYKEMNDTIFQKGISLFDDRSVLQESFTPNHLFGEVQDGGDSYEVTISLHKPSQNYCTCHRNGTCEHQIALFLSFYTHYYTTKDFISIKKLEDLLSNQSITTARSIVNQQEKEKALSYEEIWESFDEQFQQFYEEKKRSFLFSKYLVVNDAVEHFYPQLLRKAAIHRNPLEIKAIANLFVVTKILSLLDDYEELNEFQKRNIYPLLFSLDESFSKYVIDIAAHQKNEQWIHFVHGHISQLQLKTTQFLWLTFNYYSTTTSFLLTDEEILEERKQLQKIRTAQSFIARIWLLFLLNKHREARLLFVNLPLNIRLEFIETFVQELPATLSFKERFHWVKIFRRDLHEFTNVTQNEQLIRIYSEQYTQCLYDLLHDCGHRDYIENELLLLLPHTFSELESYYFEDEQDEKWIELYLMMGMSIEDIDSERVKIVSKRSPQCLLPLYHQHVEWHIQQRNRANYKAAVKYLKKLRTLYRRLKQTERFERFINQLVHKTRRLKAFQEELQKGKVCE